jgi:ATP-dependent DNA helicase RecG
MTTVAELDKLIQQDENEHVEFKKAEHQYSLDKLKEYVMALANEGGGKLILGVAPVKPRIVVGTAAFKNLEATKHDLLQAVRLRIDVEDLPHPQGRVLIFRVPSRPLGSPLQLDGRYLMRSGESLVAMTPDQLQRIFDETGPDFTAEICSEARLTDLDEGAIQVFRDKWATKSKNELLLSVPAEQLLEDAELTTDGRITFAALILLGKSKALGRYLANAEVVFEYRATEDQISSSQRAEFRHGFLAINDDLWTQVNLRNDVTSIRDGLFRMDIPAFNEDVVREAILNGVCHRDYRLGGSIFIHQFPHTLRITSPGGFPQGITPKNILRRQSPRNRRLAEACAKCGLVERSGQGMDRIFGTVLREGKALPNFDGTDAYQVVLTVRADKIDQRFLGLLDLADRHGLRLNVEHLVVLDVVRQGEQVTEQMKPLVRHLIDIGLLERQGRGKASTLILSRGMYRALGEAGIHTRVEGLDRETNKALLLKHAIRSGPSGATLEEFRQVLPSLSNDQIRHMVYELGDEHKLRNVGRARGTRWIAKQVDK